MPWSSNTCVKRSLRRRGGRLRSKSAGRAGFVNVSRSSWVRLRRPVAASRAVLGFTRRPFRQKAKRVRGVMSICAKIPVRFASGHERPGGNPVRALASYCGAVRLQEPSGRERAPRRVITRCDVEAAMAKVNVSGACSRGLCRRVWLKIPFFDSIIPRRRRDRRDRARIGGWAAIWSLPAVGLY